MWARAIRGRPFELVALVVILVVAAAVRLAFIGPPVRYDEVFSFQQYAFQPWHHIVTDYTYPNNHILHSLALHAVWRVFGGAAEVLRIPASLAGILLVPATYALGRLLYDRTAALWAAALGGGLLALDPVLDQRARLHDRDGPRGHRSRVLCTAPSLRLRASGAWAPCRAPARAASASS